MEQTFSITLFIQILFFQNKGRLKTMPSLSERTQKHLRADDVRYLKSYTIYVLATLVCWTPFMLQSLISQSFSIVKYETLTRVSFFAVLMNSIFDPMITFWRAKDVQKAIKKLFCNDDKRMVKA
jgi:hypothetical protein